MSTPDVPRLPDENPEYELVMAGFVARTVAQFPPFTPDQRARLAVLLRGDDLDDIDLMDREEVA